MPRPGFMWRHVIISTRRSWLHGNPRGFRSRGHRIHSSGDYKNPPPPGEHKGLLEYHERRAKGAAIKIPKSVRKSVLVAILDAIRNAQYRILVIAITRKHAHILVELPRRRTNVKRIVGKWKCARSKEVRTALPGSIWGEGGKYKPVRTREHLRVAYKYIRDDQGPGAVVWTYRDAFAARDRKTAPASDRSPRPSRGRSAGRNDRSGAPDSADSERLTDHPTRRIPTRWNAPHNDPGRDRIPTGNRSPRSGPPPARAARAPVQQGGTTGAEPRISFLPMTGINKPPCGVRRFRRRTPPTHENVATAHAV